MRFPIDMKAALTLHRKPAKADDDLVSYIRQLELPLAEALKNVGEGGELPLDNRLLVRSVFREIHKREATLATHKKCSLVVEQLLRAATAQQVVTFFASLEPYLDFCCTNRYSSHVMETLLGLAHGLLSGERPIVPDDGGADVDPDAPPPVPPDALQSQLVSSVIAMATSLQVRAGVS